MALQKIKENAALALVVVFLAVGVVVVAAQFIPASPSGQMVAVTLPTLSKQAAAGQVVFQENCSGCHGANGSGSEQGPPLIHDIYNPGHHDDGSFLRAAQTGSPQHHWKFGDMPPQPQVSLQQVALVIRYVRELQQANGIFYEPHNM